MIPFSGSFTDDDFQRRLDQILSDVEGLEDLLNEIQSPKKLTDKEVNEKIKVRPQSYSRHSCVSEKRLAKKNLTAYGQRANNSGTQDSTNTFDIGEKRRVRKY